MTLLLRMLSPAGTLLLLASLPGAVAGCWTALLLLLLLLLGCEGLCDCPNRNMTFSGTDASAASAKTWNCSGRSLHQVGCCSAALAAEL
mgnify:CR=1 FL=1|jgi:hypothetical protein